MNAEIKLDEEQVRLACLAYVRAAGWQPVGKGLVFIRETGEHHTEQRAQFVVEVNAVSRDGAGSADEPPRRGQRRAGENSG